MKTVAAILLLPLLVFSAFCAEEAVDFNRSAGIGDTYDTEIKLTASREYRFTVPGSEKPLIRNESANLTLFGRLRIVGVDKNGSMEQFHLKISLAGGYLNGLPFNSSLLNGKTVLAKLSPEPVFTVEDGKPLTGKAVAFLSSVFRKPPENSMRDTFGSPRVLKPKDRWPLDTSSLRNALKKRGIHLEKDAIQGRAEVLGRHVYRGCDVYEIRATVESKTTPDLDFRITASILLPVENRLNVLRLIRDGKEIVSRKLPDGDPVSAGTRVRVISTERLEVILLPVKKEESEDRKSPSWSDFILR